MDDDCDCGDQSFREALGTLLFYGVTAPFWGPPVWLADDYQAAAYLSCYPYQHDVSGFVLLNRDLPRSEDLFLWSLRVRGEYGDSFDGLTRFGGRALWESRHRFGIDTSVDYRRESLASGQQDELWTGDFNLVFRFAQSEQLVMHTGLGANYLTGDGSTDLGFNFTYCADWFPWQPWIVSVETDWGWLGSAGAFHGRATLGANLQNIEVYTGYDYFDVGSAQIGGLVAGIQLLVLNDSPTRAGRWSRPAWRSVPPARRPTRTWSDRVARRR